MFRYPSCNLSTYDRREFPGGTVYNGDCLDVIKTLPESSVDCIVTDPPYFLGMTHNGQKGNFRDLSICRPFYRDLFNEFRRVCRPEACIYFFCDWRGYAFYYPLFDEILKAHNMLVWNKLSGPGNHYAFIHELILFHAGKGANIGGTNIISDIRAFTSGAKSTDGAKVHPTQKPVALIQKFIEDATAPGAVILDTFGGSGSTAVAAVRSPAAALSSWSKTKDITIRPANALKMNTENNDIVKYPDFPLTTKEEEDVYKLASAGMRSAEIAVSMEWPPERRRAFCIIAELPGSPLALMLAAARAEGIATPQIKLQEAATAGNIDAIKELQKIQARNRFNELVNYLDDDEFTP